MEFLRIFFGGYPNQSRVYFRVSRVLKYIFKDLGTRNLDYGLFKTEIFKLYFSEIYNARTSQAANL